MLIEMCPSNATQHVVEEGDTLWKLSQSSGVSVQNIMDANPGINPQNLQIGSTLCIPANSVSPTSLHTCPKRTFSYTVRSGDTLWKLAQIYGTNVQDILDANPGTDPQNLQIGSTLCIPAARAVPAPPAKTAPMASEMPPVTCPKGTFRYTVRSGDTLWKLAQIYDVGVQDILDANPGTDPQNLQIGSTLCIPAAKAAPAPPAKVAPPAKTAPMVPAAPPTTTAPSRRFAYCIKRCDTICGIARNFFVSVESIINENPGIDPRCLQAGTCLYVPVNCCGKNTWRYTVMAGDTLNRIANKLNVSSSALIAANPNVDFQHLIHCQVICVPKE